MRAVRCEAHGAPETLVLRDLPDLTARPGQVVVDIHAAALNFPDVLTVADRYQVSTPVPFTPGSEFAGVVREVGDGVTDWSPGDRVMGTRAVGAFAEQIAAAPADLRVVPEGLDLVHAAVFQVTYSTAYHSLVTAGGLRVGEWVVVLGASGGVGSATVDIAHRLGARVLAAASDPRRLELAVRLGADASIDYATEDLKGRIKEITDGGSDLVVDPVGGAYAEQALRAIRWGGRFVSVGFAAGDVPRIPLNLVLLKNVTVRGMELRSWSQQMPEAFAAADAELARLVAEGMRPEVSRTRPLTETAKALADVARRKALGKTVIDVRG
ncbi:zinc-binding dehydrogenase [Nocardioides panzhihuensis]|uniref:NADPH2:quinone reductase n=1 Tax=Nocardioides panzhihuensis TaxID=860243 RepID=A0A7Z0DHS6_9ACTN|nr:NADPH2:quinone reductase [Nocardioides panzhihuensis]